MKRIKDYKKVLVLVVILIVALIFFVTTKQVIKNKKMKNNQAISTYTEIIDESKKEDTVLSTEDADENIENINPEDTSWDEDAEETKVDEKEEQKAKETSTNTYYIKINYIANVVTVYKKDNEGNYTIPVKALICSTGKATPTSGVYKMSNKYRWHMLNGGVYGQYCTRITGHILFHSVPYATNSPNSLKYVAYDKLGTKASAGCIRLTVEGAMWIYNNCPSGTYVEFYGSSNPGPLGKPTAKKISSNVECRNWDPTDPDSKNPWHSYVEPKNTEIVQDVKQQLDENKKEEKNNEIQKENENKTTDANTNANINTSINTNTNTNASVNTNTNINTNVNTNTKQSTSNEKVKEDTSKTSENKSTAKEQDTENQINNETKVETKINKRNTETNTNN